MDWFLIDISLRHERVNTFGKCSEKLTFLTLRYAQYSEYSEYTQDNTPFYTPFFYSFLMFSEGVKRENWIEIS